MRFVAAFIGAGIMDCYPNLRVGILECGFGWLPFWAKRMDEQAGYVGGTAPLRHDYLTSGRFFSSIEMHEGEDMFNCVRGFLGDDVLMYASDYPHPECHFPNSIDHVLGWPSLGGETRQKLFWDNATRFYKRTWEDRLWLSANTADGALAVGLPARWERVDTDGFERWSRYGNEPDFQREL